MICKYTEGGCATNGFSHRAYAWNVLETCDVKPMTMINSKMIKWVDRYFIINKPHLSMTKDGEKHKYCKI